MIFKKIFETIKHFISSILKTFLPNPQPAAEGEEAATIAGMKKILFRLFICLALGCVVPLVFDLLKYNHLIGLLDQTEGADQILRTQFSLAEGIIMLLALAIYWIMPFIRYIQKWLKVTGVIYAFSVGYLVCFLTGMVKQDQMIVMILSVILAAALALLPIYLLHYKNVMLPKPLSKITYVAFVIMTLGGSLLKILSNFPYIGIVTGRISSLLQLTGGQITTDIIKVVIAVLFIFLAFDKMLDYARRGVSRKYEWTGAFTVFYTVSIIIYKISNILGLIAAQL